MRRIPVCTPSMAGALMGVLMLLSLQAPAAPLQFSTAPPGSNYRKPAPNVIVSVDDSGSMATKDSAGVSGIETLRNALIDTFSEANVPDGSIRLAWQSMARCYTIPAGACGNLNQMRVLDSTHRSNFMTWVGTLAASGYTPSHRMLLNAGEYLRTEPGINSPWASVPGTTQEPMLSCRRSYNLFMTDGGWNYPFGIQTANPVENIPWDDGKADAAGQIRNADGTSRQLPDGASYDTGNNQPNTRIYRDNLGAGVYTDWNQRSGVVPTFADLAFFYWATDLQPNMPNNVPKRIAHPGEESYTLGMQTQVVPEYWNPRNDPATWQHMTMYTVGFNGAANWAGSATPVFSGDTWSGEDYTRLLLGQMPWFNPFAIPPDSEEKTRAPELWHAALNSRGKFIPAPTSASLAGAFRDVLNIIASDVQSALTSVVGSSSTTRTASMSFEASYSNDGWQGAVTAYNVAANTSAVSITGAWGTAVAATGDMPAKPVSTATRLDDASVSPPYRLILSNDGEKGIGWAWEQLSGAQKAALDSSGATSDGLGESRLAYLRGDRSREVANGGTFRNRKSRHGDIVNSKLWVSPGKPASGYADTSYITFRNAYASRAQMLYVGANDGMLHAFSAADGTEKLAYVPKGLYAALPQLTSVQYQHRYYVDGSPFTGDLRIGATWKTYLAGFLGAGGRGFFVLDVTDPTGFTTANEVNAVIMDKTGPGIDPDIGHVFSQPVMDPANPSTTQQIAQLNNGRWALIVGNGYNSANEQAVLIIQYLDGAREMVKIGAGAGRGNGLGAPRLVDLNGDGKPDIAYAGDLKGNLWKFDLTGGMADTWKTAFGGTPLLTARDAAGNAQPITAAPVWQPHPNGGVMVVFGTGRMLTDADRSDTSVQSIYGVRDGAAVIRSASGVSLSGGAPVANGRDSLVRQTASSAEAGRSTVGQDRLWDISANTVNFTGTNAKAGWYLDLPVPGERVLQNLEWFDGQLIDVASMVPTLDGNTTAETCDPKPVNGRAFLNTLNAITGGAPKSQIYNYLAAAATTNTTTTTTTTIGSTPAPRTASRIESSLRYGLKTDKEIISVCPSGQKCDNRLRLGKTSLRPTWRQAQ